MGAGVPAGLQIHVPQFKDWDGRFDSYTPPPLS